VGDKRKKYGLLFAQSFLLIGLLRCQLHGGFGRVPRTIRGA
jgi:hypothetical protein